MADFNEDVNIEQHDLAVYAKSGKEVSRIAHDGRLVIFTDRAGAQRGGPVRAFLPELAQLTVGPPGNGSGPQPESTPPPGTIRVMGNAGAETVVIHGGNPALPPDRDDGGSISLREKGGQETIHLNGVRGALTLGAEGGSTGTLVIRHADGSDIVTAGGSGLLTIGSQGHGGRVDVRDDEGRQVIHLDAVNATLFVGSAEHAGVVVVRDVASRDALSFDANAHELTLRDGFERDVLRFDANSAEVTIGVLGKNGSLLVRDATGGRALEFDSSTGQLSIGDSNRAGDLVLVDTFDREALKMHASNATIVAGAPGTANSPGIAGTIEVTDENGGSTIQLDGRTGDIRLTGADVAEEFPIGDGVQAAPGTVMALAADGTVRPCSDAYDRTVVGVIAGAGAYRPGIVLDRGNDADARRVPLSVMGKAACIADASYGAIQVGDLLTSSPTTGSAMCATDPTRAFGAVIGKALTPLSRGRGLVEMIVGLR